MRHTLAFTIAALLATGGTATAQNSSHLGGVVIAQLPIPGLLDPPRFIGSPSIVIMEDGTYLASHDVFWPPGDDHNTNETHVYRSSNRGQTWAHVSTIRNITYATLFANGRFLYVFGRNGEKKIITQKSSDKGSTWGAAHIVYEESITNGIAPSPPVAHDGRLWFARNSRSALSVSLTDSVLTGPWTLAKADRGAEIPSEDPPGGLPPGETSVGWTEGQIAASPHTGVVILSKTRGLPYMGLIRVRSESRVEVVAGEQYAPLPGAEKKFGCVYDDVSGRFYALTNPVLSAHSNTDEPEMVRNTAAVFSSRDLLTWRLEKIFLYSPNAATEGFGYLALAIDGDDLAVVARTALPAGGRIPPRGHDSNLLSFHRIEGFRGLRRDQMLVANTGLNRISRFEANLTTRLAPVGHFSGGGMNRPVGVAQSPTGAIFVSEQRAGGRVLRFRANGTFHSVVATEGIDFTGNPESLAFGPDRTLYLSTAFGAHSNKIWRIDTTTSDVSLFVPSSFSSGFGSGTLDEPRGIAFGPDGHLYVADRANHRIRRFRGANGEFLGNLAVQTRPQALAWDPFGLRFLFSRRPSETQHDIGRILTGGSVATLYDKGDNGMALGIVSLDGDVYFTDHDENKIYRITNESLKQATTSVSTGLSSPHNLAPVIVAPQGL